MGCVAVNARENVLLWAALVLYATLAATTVRGIGVVGEVAIGWTQGPPPTVLVDLPSQVASDEPPAGHRLGPLVASQTRPLERVDWGSGHVPLAINSYTGGLPDWPARLVHRVTGRDGAVQLFHLLCGAGLIVLLHGFLKRSAGPAAAGAAALVLASRWDFVFYRSVLGGTEAVLVGASLLAVAALWRRRWGPGSDGGVGLGLAVGLGLHAKLTFALPVLALAAAALLTRRDRGGMGPPAPIRVGRVAIAVLIPLLPLAWSAFHHGIFIDDSIHVRSHDHAALQLERVRLALTGGPAQSRESLGNLVPWLGAPLTFFKRAYGVASTPTPPWGLVGAGWTITLSGTAFSWFGRHPTPRDALVRLGSVAAVLSVGLLLVVARDLHHLAAASALVAMWVGLAADQVAARYAGRRSLKRQAIAALLVSPWLLWGSHALWHTDAVVAAVEVPTFSADGQAELGAMVAGCSVVWVSDYESMGALERHTTARVVHAWGAASRRAGDADRAEAFPRELLGAVADDRGCLLLSEASAPMIYNLRIRGRRLTSAVEAAGVVLDEVARNDAGTATVYRVQRLASP